MSDRHKAKIWTPTKLAWGPPFFEPDHSSIKILSCFHFLSKRLKALKHEDTRSVRRPIETWCCSRGVKTCYHCFDRRGKVNPSFQACLTCLCIWLKHLNFFLPSLLISYSATITSLCSPNNSIGKPLLGHLCFQQFWVYSADHHLFVFTAGYTSTFSRGFYIQSIFYTIPIRWKGYTQR